MPLLTLATNQAIEDQTGTCKIISQRIAELLGKPESYVMVMLRDEQSMSFAGTDDPTALLELKSLGLPEDQTSQFSTALCTMIGDLLNILPNRIYIEFSSPPRHLWGWDNRTF